jgi:glycosyltransferase involved in cell wall biosynthesis
MNPVTSSTLRIAVILPCYNEAGAIGQVVDGFKGALPRAEVHVFDNNSTDGTAAVAAAHGARQGQRRAPHVRRRRSGRVRDDRWRRHL